MVGRQLGMIFLFGFVATQAVRDVELGSLFGSLSIFEVALLAFATAAFLFASGLLLFRRDQIALLVRFWPIVIFLNLTTMVAWLSYFGSLKLIEPAAANLAFSGIAPIAVTALALLGLRNPGERQASILETWIHLALLGTIVLLAFVTAGGMSGFAAIRPLAGFEGVFFASFAGVVITIETILAKRLNLAGISPLAIVGVRFLFVTLVSAYMINRSGHAYAGLTAGKILIQAVIFLIILIGPIYLGQAGLALTSPLVSGIILSLGPVATLALQSVAGTVAFAQAMLGVTFLYGVLSIAASVLAAKPAKDEVSADAVSVVSGGGGGLA